jgi:hypothetical protein
MDKLLYYIAMTEPFPLQASVEGKPANKAALTIVATNNSGKDVALQGIIVKIPVGTEALQLTNDAPDIQHIPPANWDSKDPQYPTGFVLYNFIPQVGYGTLPANSSLNFVFNNIAVNTVTGSVDIHVIEGSGKCIPPNCPTQTLTVTKFPNGWGKVSLFVEPPVISSGGSVSLEWEGPVGATYTIEYYTPQSGIVVIPAAGKPKLANKGKYPGQDDPPLTLKQTTIFTLDVEENIDGRMYQAQEQKTATVENQGPEVASFDITALPLQPGKPPTFRLAWQLKNEGSFEITEQSGTNPPVALTGIPRDATSVEVHPFTAQTIYKITAYPTLRAASMKESKSQTTKI